MCTSLEHMHGLSPSKLHTCKTSLLTFAKMKQLITSHSVFMSFDCESFLAGRHRPQLDQPTPCPCGQDSSPRGKLARCAGPVICNLTALVCHLESSKGMKV